MPAKKVDLAGKVFGKLTVLEYSHSNRYAYWKCRCECGKETIVRSSHLIAGATMTCGCVNSEIAKKNVKLAQAAHRKHGESRSRLHIIWTNMRYRCDKPNQTGYEYYGGRGIKVCPEWENSFIVFRKWALSNGYDDNLTIDRIDVNGNYEPSNCRWVDTVVQANNKRNNTFITFNGETKTAAQWAKECGVASSTFFRWLKNGEDIQDILLKRCGKHRLIQHKCEICGKSFTSHSHKSMYCSDECSRIGGNKAQQIRRMQKKAA